MATPDVVRKTLGAALVIVAVAFLLQILWPRRIAPDPREHARDASSAQQDVRRGEVRGVRPDSTLPMAPATATTPGSNRLAFAGADVKTIHEGLVVALRFNPETTNALGEFDLVVRIPKGNSARILDLTPDDVSTFTEVSKRVSADGKFAIFQGTPQRAGAMQFGLSVSQPTTADLRGTCGIEPFELDIQPAGATPRRP